MHFDQGKQTEASYFAFSRVCIAMGIEGAEVERHLIAAGLVDVGRYLPAYLLATPSIHGLAEVRWILTLLRFPLVRDKGLGVGMVDGLHGSREQIRIASFCTGSRVEKPRRTSVGTRRQW